MGAIRDVEEESVRAGGSAEARGCERPAVASFSGASRNRGSGVFPPARNSARMPIRTTAQKPAMPMSMSRMMAPTVSYEDVYEDLVVEYGPYLPTLARKLEAGDFA